MKMQNLAVRHSKLTFAALQLKVTNNKEENLRNLESVLTRTVEDHKPDIIGLPECWNCPYANDMFPSFSENLSDISKSQSATLLSKLAKENNIFIIGGSIPENDNGKLYNTSISFGPSGELLGIFRKVHLFDIDVPGKIRFVESETLSPGDRFTIIPTRKFFFLFCLSQNCCLTVNSMVQYWSGNMLRCPISRTSPLLSRERV